MPCNNKKSPSKKSDKLKIKRLRTMRIKRRCKKFSVWKNNWNNSPKKPKSRSSPSIKKKNKFGSFIRTTLLKRQKSNKSKPNSRKKKKKAHPNRNKSTNTQSASSNRKSRSFNRTELKSKNREMRRYVPLKGRKRIWKPSWKEKNSFWKKRKSS